MKKIPKFVLLRAFESAARLRSFTLAANELHLTQSAISHQIRELEDYFGRPLFERKNRTVEPTPEGVRLQKNLIRVFEALEAACNEVSLTPSAQVLTVHCAPSFAAKWLGPRLPEFMKLNPDISVRLTTGAEPIDLTRVLDVDIAISYASVIEKSGVEATSLGEEKILPLCSPSIIDPNLSAARQISESTLIASQLSHTNWAGWFEKRGLELPSQPQLSFDRAALAIAAAVDGMGVVLESERLAEREIAKGDLVIIGDGIFETTFVDTHFVSFRSDDLRLAKVKKFRDWLYQTCGIAS